MKYKKIITSGCSFSDAATPYTWPNQLESYIKRDYPNVKFDHRGLSSQGQELIQKKATHAIYEALSEGYKSEELCVFVMWTSNDRKSFFVDSKDFIKHIFENWKLSNQGWQLQLADLKNNLQDPDVVYSTANVNNKISYNKSGGWLITSAHVVDEISMIRDYFMMSKSVSSPGYVNLNLENIIFLQSFCKLHGIKLYQQYVIDYIIEDFERVKDHQIVKYLYDQLDHSTFISTIPMYNYLLDKAECFKEKGDSHPNGLGHRIWLTDVILPKLEDDDFFN